MVHYDTILQNTTDFIAKCNSNFITKCDEGLLQMQPFCYRIRQLLQNSMFITKCAGTAFNITNETKSNETKFVSKNKSVAPQRRFRKVSALQNKHIQASIYWDIDYNSDGFRLKQRKKSYNLHSLKSFNLSKFSFLFEQKIS